jgi:Helix-turn-helix domain
VQHLDQKQLAERWLISQRTLEQWRWQGRGPRYLKIGRRVIYRMSDIDAFESGRVHSNTNGPIELGAEAEPADGNR